jgi:hypothetical protein
VKLETEIADRIEHRAVVRLPRRDDAAPDRKRLDAELGESCHERRGWRIGEALLLACLRRVEKRAVLGDDALEQLDARKYALQIVELAARDEQQPAAGRDDALQRRKCHVVDAPVVGERAVVIAAESEIAHERIAFGTARNEARSGLLNVAPVEVGACSNRP